VSVIWNSTLNIDQFRDRASPPAPSHHRITLQAKQRAIARTFNMIGVDAKLTSHSLVWLIPDSFSA
jgi:hypothetical protein